MIGADRVDWAHVEGRRGLPIAERLPLGPVLAIEGTDHAALAARLGCSTRSLARWAKTGFGPYVADTVAVALGRHPSEVWGDDWWSLVFSEEVSPPDVEAAS